MKAIFSGWSREMNEKFENGENQGGIPLLVKGVHF